MIPRLSRFVDFTGHTRTAFTEDVPLRYRSDALHCDLVYGDYPAAFTCLPHVLHHHTPCLLLPFALHTPTFCYDLIAVSLPPFTFWYVLHDFTYTFVTWTLPSHVLLGHARLQFTYVATFGYVSRSILFYVPVYRTAGYVTLRSLRFTVRCCVTYVYAGLIRFLFPYTPARFVVDSTRCSLAYVGCSFHVTFPYHIVRFHTLLRLRYSRCYYVAGLHRYVVGYDFIPGTLLLFPFYFVVI